MKTDPVSAANAYRNALRQLLNASTLHGAKKIAAQALEITYTPPEAGMLSVQSGFGHATSQPFVTLGMANPTETANPTVQFGTDQARTVAHQILAAADAAESDGFLVEWVGALAGLDDAACATMLAQFREWRDARRTRGTS